MFKTRHDYSIFEKFNFERKPVGVKFLLNRPQGITQIDQRLAICHMFMEAQTREPFYAAKENFGCMETLLLGLTEPEPFFESGQIGDKEKIYQEARANRRIYQSLPKLAKNTARYVAFSPVDKLPFDPDVLVITANPPQGEILLRALSYSTGKPLTAKYTPVLVCAWILFHPFVNGEINYTITGLGYGMRMRKILPEGMLLISVPYDVIPMLIENLHEMDWVLPITTLSDEERGKYSAKIMEEIKKEYANG